MSAPEQMPDAPARPGNPYGELQLTDRTLAVIALSDEERRAQRLAPATLEHAVRLVQMNGYVLFDQVIDDALIARVRAEALAELARVSARERSNRGTNRYRLRMPFRAPYDDAALSANPIMLQVLDAFLGEDCVCDYFSCDIALPGSKYQNVHSDAPLESTTAPPPALVVNIPLVDFTDGNGPLEIWPGATHLMPGYFKGMDAFARRLPYHRVFTKAGSLLVRDIRCWHRGTANLSQEPRPNFAMVFTRDRLDDNYDILGITPEQFRGLTPRQQRIFRHERSPWTGTRLLTRARDVQNVTVYKAKQALRAHAPGLTQLLRRLLGRGAKEEIGYTVAAADVDSIDADKGEP